MCRALNEGGQRCHTHAKQRLDAVTADALEAEAQFFATGREPDQPRNRAAHRRARARYSDALAALAGARAEYASTPKGERALRAMLATGDGLLPNGLALRVQPTPYDLQSALNRGLQIRERNNAVRDTLQEMRETRATPAPEPRPISDEQRRTITRQIGSGNILAVSGGRITPLRDGVELPVAHGYRVRVRLAPNDTYTVQRVLVRGGKEHDKGTKTDVYFDQVGEQAYRAGMYASYDADEW